MSTRWLTRVGVVDSATRKSVLKPSPFSLICAMYENSGLFRGILCLLTEIGAMRDSLEESERMRSERVECLRWTVFIVCAIVHYILLVR